MGHIPICAQGLLLTLYPEIISSDETPEIEPNMAEYNVTSCTISSVPKNCLLCLEILLLFPIHKVPFIQNLLWPFQSDVFFVSFLWLHFLFECDLCEYIS